MRSSLAAGPRFVRRTGWVVVLLVILVVLLAIVLCARARRKSGAALGGAPGRPRMPWPTPESPHLVVDTLNLTHWARAGDPARPLTTCDIIGTIGESAPLLRKRFSGNVMFVAKDRETTSNDKLVRALYARAAKEHGVHVHLVEKYGDGAGSAWGALGPPLGVPASHAERGRDDFLMGVLARRHRCRVLSRDRFRDFAELKGEVRPFLVREFSPHRDLPETQQYNPGAAEYAALRAPRRLDPADALPELALPGRD